ncbi:MAG: RNA polymerase sigma factor [Planctomycetaceae bacterium]
MNDVSPPTSATLLGKIGENDQEAWERFVRLYGPLVYNWCRNAGLQAADGADVVQIVLQTVMTKIQSFDPGRKSAGAFRSWLWGITRHRILDHFRNKGKGTPGIGGSDANIRLARLEQEPNEPESVSGTTARQLLLKSAIEILRAEFDPRTWQAFWRMAVDGNPASAVGEELDMSSKAVRQAKFRVTKKLRGLLQDDLPDVFGPLKVPEA